MSILDDSLDHVLPLSFDIPDLDQVRTHFLALNRPARCVRFASSVMSAVWLWRTVNCLGLLRQSPNRLQWRCDGIGSLHATGIYITQNPVDPDLLARAQTA